MPTVDDWMRIGDDDYVLIDKVVSVFRDSDNDLSLDIEGGDLLTISTGYEEGVFKALGIRRDPSGTSPEAWKS